MRHSRWAIRGAVASAGQRDLWIAGIIARAARRPPGFSGRPVAPRAT